MTMMKALYLDYSQDLTTTTNIFKKWLSYALVCSKVKVSQTREIIDVMSRESNLSAIGSFDSTMRDKNFKIFIIPFIFFTTIVS